jgi:uncharacterized repeat protein (TIGR03803 family)
MNGSGNLYGTTNCDGANGWGNVFKLANTENGWLYSSLHDFTNSGGDGGYPVSSVSFDTNGNLYGTASSGGNNNCQPVNGCGIVWMIEP